ncbi:MAG: hypothetical protein LBN07_02500 [Christensenellaceae bacterium]|jgi:hypothetical protein|nr:hypothetical protein [Christensenellaceae bacterium]
MYRTTKLERLDEKNIKPMPLASEVKERMEIELLLREAFTNAAYDNISKTAKELVESGVTVAQIEAQTERFAKQHEGFYEPERFMHKDNLSDAFLSLRINLSDVSGMYPTAEQIIEDAHYRDLFGKTDDVIEREEPGFKWVNPVEGYGSNVSSPKAAIEESKNIGGQ